MPRSLTSLPLSEYHAVVAEIPPQCGTAVFRVAGHTFTNLRPVAYMRNVLGAVAATSTANGVWDETVS